MRPALAFLARIVVAAAASLFVLRLAAMIRYPYGGGEFHVIFAYPAGTFDAARGVFLTYLAASVAVAVLLVAAGVRLRWWVIGLVASAVCLEAWWQICTFAYGLPEVREPGLRLLPLIPLAILGTAFLAHAGRGRFASPAR